MSFLDEESVLNFVFQLCDMNGDGHIDAEDLALFVRFPIFLVARKHPGRVSAEGGHDGAEEGDDKA